MVAVVLLFLSVAIQAQQAVRMSWETFAQVPARVQSLRNGVAVMKSRNTADPTSALYRTSWQYWGAMHGYFGPGSVFGTLEEAISDYQNSGADPSLLTDFQGITDMTPPDAVAEQVWGNASTVHPGFSPGTGSIFITSSRCSSRRPAIRRFGFPTGITRIPRT